MHNIKSILVLYWVIGSSFASLAQTSACTSKQHNQFDFWLGAWNVYDTNGVKVGENTISKQYSNCLIVEEWQSAGVNRGTSYNYYNTQDSSWNQLWIDNQGSILELEGGIEEGKMVLRSKPFKVNAGEDRINQISWVPRSNNTVHQIWEVYSTDGLLVNTLFHGVYTPKEK